MLDLKVLVKTTGNFTDDFPRNGDLYTDLQFFEKEFWWGYAFEIIIDAKDTNGLIKPPIMSKMNELQDEF